MASGPPETVRRGRHRAAGRARVMFTSPFWQDVAERAAKTAAQSALLALGADAAAVWSADPLDVLGLAGGGALLSVLTSLTTAGATRDGRVSAARRVGASRRPGS